MSLLWEAFQKADEDEMKEIIHERAHNSRLHKLLKTKKHPKARTERRCG